jgi:very-short-patch-repair endonuclease
VCHPRAFVGQSRAMSRDLHGCPNNSGPDESRGPDRVLGEISDAQHRVVHLEQLRSIPLSRPEIEHRLRIGRLHHVLPRVYAVGGAHLTREGRLKAATLWAGPGAVISHRTAAGLWSLLPAGEVIHVTTSRRRGPRPGLILHQRRLPADERTTVDGIPTTTAARTLLDIAATEGRRAFERALRQAEYLQLTDATPLLTLIARYPNARGTRIARAVLEARRPSGHTESELEDRFVEFLTERGLQLPRLNANLQVEGRRFRVDCLWEAERVVVELDGRRAHEGFERNEADAERDLMLASNGYLVVRVTWRHLHHDPDGLERNLRALLASRRAHAA